jgi:hypothetical protein
VKADSIDLFIRADSLGWAQASRRGFAEDLFPFRAPCDTFLGDSLACDATIITGAAPSQHGHFAPFVFDPDHSPFGWARGLGWIPEPIATQRFVRGRLSRWVAARGDFDADFQLYRFPFSRLPWFDCAEKRDIYLPGGIHGGQTMIFEDWENSGIPWLRSDWRAGDAVNIAALKDEIDRAEIRLGWLSLTGLDSMMHGHTTSGAATDAAFADVERVLREIHALAQTRYREVRIHLFGNHGMTDTEGLSEMMLDFEKAGFAFPRDCAAVWDFTMARFWFPGGDAIREHICDWLRGRAEGRILTEEELAAWGCDFPGRRYGEIIFLLKSGTIFAPSFVSRGGLPAMHGYDPTQPDSRTCWLTTERCENAPSRIDGIYRVMRAAAERIARTPAQG